MKKNRGLNRQLLSSDGLHLSPEGIEIMASNMECAALAVSSSGNSKTHVQSSHRHFVASPEPTECCQHQKSGERCQ